jgi:hypothetical protein
VTELRNDIETQTGVSAGLVHHHLPDVRTQKIGIEAQIPELQNHTGQQAIESQRGSLSVLNPAKPHLRRDEDQNRSNLLHSDPED